MYIANIMKYVLSIFIALSCIMGNMAIAETHQDEVYISNDRLYVNGISFSFYALRYDEKNYITVNDLYNIFDVCNIEAENVNDFYEFKDDTVIQCGYIGSDNYNISKLLWHFNDKMSETYCIEYRDSLFVPLREIAETANMLVSYNLSLESIFINKPLTTPDYKCFDDLNYLTRSINDIYEYSGAIIYSQDQNGNIKPKSTQLYEWDTLINMCNTLLDSIPHYSGSFEWYYNRIYQLTNNISICSKQMTELCSLNSEKDRKYEIKTNIQENRGALKSIIIILNANIQALKDTL